MVKKREANKFLKVNQGFENIGRSRLRWLEYLENDK
jgi:hypothetical protein